MKPVVKEGNTIAKRITALLLAAMLLAGCKSSDPGTVNTNPQPGEPAVEKVDNQNLSMLDAPEIAYEKESMVSSIHVDLVGYEAEAEKLAVIEAPILPRRFSVINKNTGETVYNGYVKEKDSVEDSGEALFGILDFSGVTAEGTYYIEADLVGRSLDFKVRTGIYGELFEDTFSGLKKLRDRDDDPQMLSLEDNGDIKKEVSGGWVTGEKGQKDVCEGCLAIQDLMWGLEYYPTSFAGDGDGQNPGNGIPDVIDEIIFEATWLLKMQNPETGGVYTSVSPANADSGSKKLVILGETTRATAYFCATMARLSSVLNKYDSALSKKCLDAANRSWKCLEVNKDLVDNTQMFRAAVEMYRISGKKVYKDIIDKYLKDNAGREYADRISLDGAITYMATTRSTDRDYCTLLMDRFMERTELKSNSAKNAGYLVEEDVSDEAVLLRNLTELLIINYVISNKEYGTIEENYLHYLCGRNPDNAVCNSLSHSPDAYAQFLFLLGKLTYMHK